MKIRLQLIWNLIFLLPSAPHAAQYTVTEDSSSIGTTVHLTPTPQGPTDSTAVLATELPGTPPATTDSAPQTNTAAETAIQQPTTPTIVEEPAGTAQTPSTDSPATAPGENAAAPETPQTPVDSATIVTTDTSNQTATGTLVITSLPDSSAIVINDVSVGFTPYNATGFYPGIYEISLYKEGFQQFRKTVDLKVNSTEYVTGTLEIEPGYLFIATIPDSATVTLNDTIIGQTPITTPPLSPGMYRLRVERSGYAPYTEQLAITSKLTDTIQTTLISLEKPVTLGNFGLVKSRNVRRIAFGSAGIVAAATGFFLNLATIRNINNEQQALDRYMQPEKSEKDYDLLYNNYTRSTKETDRLANARNVWYTLAIISGIGFGLSIPF